MRVLFCTTGGAGHLLPLRPLAEALLARGHDLAWATAPDAGHLLDGQGFERFAVGPTFEASRRRFRSDFPDAARLVGEQLSAYTFPRLFGAVLAPGMLNDLARVVRRWQPDCVVHEPAALAVPLVCRQQGLRHVAHGYGLRPAADYIAAAMVCFGRHWRERGLHAPADGDLYRHLYLDIAPAGLQPLWANSDGRLLRFNPYVPAPASSMALPVGLRHALALPQSRRPRIYLTFGTVFNRGPALAVAVQAAARLGGTLVVTLGEDGDPARLGGLPGHVHVLRFVDQRALLLHCDVVVSHAGAGTVLGSAAHGLPQLLLPQAADHFRNATALCASGSAISVDPQYQTVDVVASALQRLLSQASYAAGAQRLAMEMATMADAATTAQRFEQWHGRGEAR